jgi:hypothetical protein
LNHNIVNRPECHHPDARLVKVIASGTGAEMFACQCVICGNKATTWIPHKCIKFPGDVPDEKSKTPTIRELMSKSIEQLKELKQLALEQAWEFRNSYRLNYYKSPQWADLRERTLQRAGYVCEQCRVNRAKQAHHLTYERLGNELLNDLLAVCISCHEELHGIDRQKFMAQIGEAAA